MQPLEKLKGIDKICSFNEKRGDITGTWRGGNKLPAPHHHRSKK